MEKVKEISEEIFSELKNRMMFQYKKEHWKKKLTALIESKVQQAYNEGELCLAQKVDDLNKKLKDALKKPQATLGSRLKYLFTGKL